MTQGTRSRSRHRCGFATLRCPARALAAMLFVAAMMLDPTAGLLPASALQAAGMRLEDYETGPYELGGDFTLTTHQGKQARLKDYQGRVVLVFFGYTFCPDVCPTTLTEITRMQKLLGASAKRVQPVFITVDPERDTAPRLKSYLTNFAPGIVGMTGTEAELREVAKRYQARFSRHAAKAGEPYLVDHTGFVYMLDGTGKVRYLFTYDAGADILVQGARKLLAPPLKG